MSEPAIYGRSPIADWIEAQQWMNAAYRDALSEAEETGDWSKFRAIARIVGETVIARYFADNLA